MPRPAGKLRRIINLVWKDQPGHEEAGWFVGITLFTLPWFFVTSLTLANPMPHEEDTFNEIANWAVVGVVVACTVGLTVASVRAYRKLKPLL